MGDEAVRVVVRCRPPNAKEQAEGRKSCVDADSSHAQIRITAPQTGSDVAAGDVKSFTFDAVYDHTSTQKAVYEETAFALVESVISGFNGTIFAYGQTGSGKTWSMQGASHPPELRGITPNSFEHIFEAIAAANAGQGEGEKQREFLVRCAYLEIYNEELRDLLSADYEKKLDLREDPEKGVFVPDLTYAAVDSADTMDRVMTEGNRHRHVGATAMNAVSSRSHSIFTVVIEAAETKEGRECITRGKLNLVDLAGSERISKTGAQGTRMKEGIKINLSLTALGNVISALVDGKTKHIPYRDSKLTRLLQDSLGGNTKTVMLAAINDADYNYEETLSTLRYANRAKNIKNKPVINEDPKDALLRQYKDEIERLKAVLLEHLSGAGVAPEALAALLGGAAKAGTKHPGRPVRGAMPVAQVNSQPAQAQVATENASTQESEPRAVGHDGPVVLSGGTRDSVEQVDPVTMDNIVADETQNALAAARAEAERERAEREELSNKLAALQHMLLGSEMHSPGKSQQVPLQSSEVADTNSQVVGSDALETSGAINDVAAAPESPEMLAKIHEARKAQMKLRLQKKKEAKLREEQAALAEEKAAIEEEMKLVSSDLTEKEKALKKLRSKYSAKVEAVKREFADAQDEWRLERESMMTTLREQTKEMKLLEQVVLTFLSPSELGKLWERSEWDEDRERWNMPRLKPKAGWRQRTNSSIAAGSPGGYGYEEEDGGGAYVDDESPTERYPPDFTNNSSLPSLAPMPGLMPGGKPSKVAGRSSQGSLPDIGNSRTNGYASTPTAKSDAGLDSPLPILLKTNGVTLANFSSWSPTKAERSDWAQGYASHNLPVISPASNNDRGSRCGGAAAMVSPPSNALPALQPGPVRTHQRAPSKPQPTDNAAFEITDEYSTEQFEDDDDAHKGQGSGHGGGSKYHNHRKFRDSTEMGGLPGLSGKPQPPLDSETNGVGISVLAASRVNVESDGAAENADFFNGADFRDGFAMLPAVGGSLLRTGLGGASATRTPSEIGKPTESGGRPSSRGATRAVRDRGRVIAAANGDQTPSSVDSKPSLPALGKQPAKGPTGALGTLAGSGSGSGLPQLGGGAKKPVAAVATSRKGGSGGTLPSV